MPCTIETVVLVRTVCPYCHKEQRNTHVKVTIMPDQTVVVLSRTLKQCSECNKGYVVDIPDTFDVSKIEGEENRR